MPARSRRSTSILTHSRSIAGGNAYSSVARMGRFVSGTLRPTRRNPRADWQGSIRLPARRDCGAGRVGDESARSLELRDVASSQLLRSFKPPIEEPLAIRAVAIMPDARLVAAMARRLDASGQYDEDASILAAWESDSGRLVRKIEATRVSVVALSPDGTLFAAGDEDGRIAIWPLPEGEPVAILEGRRNRVNCLLFGPDPLRRNDAPRPGTPGCWPRATREEP